MLEKIDDINDKTIAFGGDFKLFFEAKLKAQGGNPALKKKSLAKLIQVKENFDLCDIWRIRNPNTKLYTFRHCKEERDKLYQGKINGAIIRRRCD